MPANLPGLIDAEAHNLVNVTVDDSYPDPFTNNSILYTGDWSAGQDCPYCFAQPDDKSKVYNASWHDTTYDNKDRRPSGTAAFNFTGRLPISCDYSRLNSISFRIRCIRVRDPQRRWNA